MVGGAGLPHPVDAEFPHGSAAVIASVHALMQRHGSIASVEKFARGIAGSAAAAFQEAFAGVPDSPARRFVRDLVAYMVDRDR